MFEKENNVKGNKKTIIIAIIAAVVVLAIAGVAIFAINNNEGAQVGQDKTIKLYNELTKKEKYNFNTFLNEENKLYYSKDKDTAYVDTIYEGEESKFVVKDGNSYLLDDEYKVYYTYKNNEMDLKKIERQLEEVKELEYVAGKEKIDNKEYKYEEYAITTEFLFKYFENTEANNGKTRFYYDGDKLVYIKTMVGNYEELLKVDISYNVNSKLFEIPSDYKEA